MTSMEILNNILTSLQSVFSLQTREPILFSSGTFWIIFIVFISVYSLIRRQKVQMMLYVTAFSLYFYYRANGFMFLILPGTAFTGHWLFLFISLKANGKEDSTLFTPSASAQVSCSVSNTVTFSLRHGIIYWQITCSHSTYSCLSAYPFIHFKPSVI